MKLTFTYKTMSGVSQLSDPVNPNRSKVEFFVRAGDLPLDMPAHGNPRQPNLDRRLVDEIKGSFLDKSDDTFHWKNRGLTVMAETVNISGDSQTVTVEISNDPEDKGGVIDGRHTEQLLLHPEHREALHSLASMRPDQPVRVSVMYGLERHRRTGVTTGLNRSNAVPVLTAYHSHGYFNSLEQATFNTALEGRIQFMQNGPGEVAVAHVIELLYTLRLDLFKDNLRSVVNKGRGKHPVYALTASRQDIHSNFPEEISEYEKFYSILPEVAELYDYIEGESVRIYSKQKQSKKIFKEGEYSTTFFAHAATHSLHWYAVLPMISAFRFLLQEVSGKYQWKIPFGQVKNLYSDVCGTWIGRLTRQIDVDVADNSLRISHLHHLAKIRDEWVRFYDELRTEFTDRGYSRYLVDDTEEELEENWSDAFLLT